MPPRHEAVPSSRRYGSADFFLTQFARSLLHPADVQAQILVGGGAPVDRLTFELWREAHLPGDVWT